MSSKSQAERAARAAQLAQRPGRTAASAAADDEGAPAPAPAPRAAPRAKPVRITTDLAPQTYRGLTAYCTGLAEELGRAKVPHAEVVRALIGVLQQDEALQRRVAGDVNDRLSK